MMTPLEIRDLAGKFLACDAMTGKCSEPLEPATLRVYEKLHQSLGLVVGTAAFRSLACRALLLAREEVPSMGAVQIAADGSLQGLSEVMLRGEPGSKSVNDGGVVLIGHLLSLLLVFLGEALTLSLLRNAWPDASFDARDAENGRML